MAKAAMVSFLLRNRCYFINHSNISMHLKNSLPDRRQAHYSFHVVTVPGEHSGLWPCGSQDLWPHVENH